jgi:RNA polymerase sigma-B factor
MDAPRGSDSPSRTRTGGERRGATKMDAPELAAALAEYRSTRDRRTRNRIVETHLHLVDHYVAVYSRHGSVPAEDLRQAALLALIGAVDRFDPDGGASLSTFATRTIDGELKRYLRDRTWLVRPPRSAQETHLNSRAASEELAHELGRSPTVDEVADRLGVAVDRVLLGMVAGQARNNESIDRPLSDEGAASRLEAVLGESDDRYDFTESMMSLEAGLARLDDRQRQVLELRFGHELSQPEIAERMGVSQSYVSRIIQNTLSTLRTEFS